MPKLNILQPPYHNTDPLVLGAQGAVGIDLDFDELGGMHKRPGLWPYWRLGVMAGVDGCFWWPDAQQMIVVIDGYILRFPAYGAAPIEASSVECRLLANSPVQFASLGAQLIMANGSRLVRILATGHAEYLNRPDDPEHADYIASYNGKLIVNERGTSRATYTDYVAPTDTSLPVFVTGDDLTPEASSDALTNITNYGSEILLCGPKSVEFWQDVGSSPNPFSRSSFMLEFGLAAPNGIVVANGAVFWLTENRRVIALTGHSPQVISLPIESCLKALRNPTDCKAFALDHYVVFTFPADNVTWAFDFISANWVRWGFWNEDLAGYERYLGQNAVFVPEWGQWFVGLKSDGRLAISSPDIYTDLGSAIRSQWDSAHIDHDSTNWKLAAEVSLRYRKGIR